jgi:hypothetical protein
MKPDEIPKEVIEVLDRIAEIFKTDENSENQNT